MVPHAAVIGSGPNGLTAACSLAQAGWDVTVYEAGARPGGAAQSAEIFSDGIISDLGASIHPLSAASPAYTSLLPEGAVEWVHPEIPAAHGIDGGAPALLHRSLELTAEQLGPDAGRWRQVIKPLVDNWPAVSSSVFTPMNRPWGTVATGGEVTGDVSVPSRIQALLQLGPVGLLPAATLMRGLRTEHASALFAGLAAHSTTPLTRPMTSVFGTVFAAAAHAVGWPAVRGGTGQLVSALVQALEQAGGQLKTDVTVTGIAPRGQRVGCTQWQVQGVSGTASGRRRRRVNAQKPADVVLCDLTPQQLLHLEEVPLSPRARRAYAQYDYGPGVVKVDYVIDGPIPWTQADMAQAGTVHLGGAAGQIVASEAAVSRGVLPARPYVLLAQPSAADETRTPDHRTVAWAYAHVPRGLSGEAVDRAVRLMEDEITRQAPQFRDAVLERKVWSPSALEQWNPNLVGGSIAGGAVSLRSMVSGPASVWSPYASGMPGVLICSSSAPPGGGAHGMSGYQAAAVALRQFG